MLIFNEAELAILAAGGGVPIGVFVRLETDPITRVWLGFGNIKPGVNAYDEAGAVYKGLGELRGMPAVNQLLNGAAERIDFIMSGVSGSVFDIAQGDDAEQIQGKSLDVGFAIFGARWKLAGPVHWVSRYIADVLSFNQQPAAPGDPIVRTLTLSSASRFTRRRRPGFSYFTDQDQQGRYPGDLSCSLVVNYAHGFIKQFPVYS